MIAKNRVTVKLFVGARYVPETVKKASQIAPTTQAQAVVDKGNVGIPSDEDKKFVLGLTALTVVLGIGFLALFCFVYRAKLDDNFC